jgi:NitT/TauT family transport system substrate-binding protein
VAVKAVKFGIRLSRPTTEIVFQFVWPSETPCGDKQERKRNCMTKLTRILAMLLAFVLIAAACGTDDEPVAEEEPAAEAPEAEPVAAAETDQVFFILDWVPKGQTSPFYLALDKGFWAERGIAVQITRGYGSGDTSARIGLGEGDFGFAGVGAVMRTISEGLPLVEIAAIASTAPTAVYAAPGLGVSGGDAATLVGLRGAVDAGDENDQLFKAFAGSEGISYDDIDWQYVDGAGIGSISTGQADFVMDWITNLPEWWLADPPIEPDTFWVGRSVDIYGNGLITRPELLESDRDLVERFVAGAMEGYQYVIENGASGHQESIDALFKYNPELREQPNAEEFHLGNLQLFLTLMLTEDVRDDGIGYFDPVKTQRSLDFINDFLLDAPLTLDQAFVTDLIIDKGDALIADFDGARAALETVLGRPNPLSAFLE